MYSTIYKEIKSSWIVMQLVNQVESWNLCQYPALLKVCLHVLIIRLCFRSDCSWRWCCVQCADALASCLFWDVQKYDKSRDLENTHSPHHNLWLPLTHTIQSLTHTHKPPDWSHRLDAPFASSLCAWPWPLTSPRRSKAQVSRSLGSRQFDIKLNSFRDQSNSLCGSG